LAFDLDRKLLKSGVITEPRVLEANATSISGRTRTIAATASICGGIQELPDEPLTTAVVLDSTGSMGSSDPAAVAGDYTTTQRYKAAKTFVEQLAATDVAAVASFDDSTKPTAPFISLKVHQGFTSDRALLAQAVGAASFEAGGTPLWNAAYDTADLLASQSGVNKIVLLLTDGQNTATNSKTVGDAINNALLGGVRIYPIGLGSDLNVPSLNSLAKETGGQFVLARQASQLQAAFQSILDSLRSAGCVQLTFTPAPAAGETVTGFVEFKVEGQKLSSRFAARF
jgi:von Willebrand factor type A domain